MRRALFWMLVAGFVAAAVRWWQAADRTAIEGASGDTDQARNSVAELEKLPRQALFELARERGISPEQRILMSRQELLSALAGRSVAGQAQR